MSSHFKHINFSYLQELSENDLRFQQEMVGIFLKQIPEFLSNLHRYLANKDNKQLAKEAHTAKSSVLVFMMEETGKKLKNIQLLAEENALEKIPPLLEEISSELHQAISELNQFIKKTK